MLENNISRQIQIFWRNIKTMKKIDIGREKVFF